MRGKLILLLFLVTYTVAPTEGGLLDDAKDALSGATEGAKDGISNAFGGAKDFWNKLKDKTTSAFGNIKDETTKKLMDALPDRVKEWMGKGDFSNANVTELLETPPEVWNAMKPEKLKTLGREKLDKLLMDGEGKLPPRVIAELERIRANNMTKEQVREYLMANKDKIQDLSASELNTLKKKLGNPKDFSKPDITEMKDYVLAMPLGQLFKVKDKNARMTIVSYMQKCIKDESDKPAHCPPKAKTERLMQALQKKNRGKADKFTNETLAAMKNEETLSKLTIPEIRMIKPVVLNSQFDAFTSKAPNDTTREHKKGLILAKRLLQGQGITMKATKTAVEVNAVYDRMNYLSQYVLPSFVPKAAIEEDDVLKGKLMDNAEMMANKGVLDPKESRMAFKEMMKGFTVNNLTIDQMRNMGGLLAMASPSVLMNLTKSEKLMDSETLVKVANGLKSAKGPGFRSKARTILDALVKQNWKSVDQIPPDMIEMVPAATIDGMTVNSLTEMLKKKPQPKLTDEQKNIILKKISADRLTGSPAVIVNSIPFTAVKAKDATELGKLSATLPQGSSTALLYVSKELDKRTNKSLISPADLEGYDGVVQKNLGPKHIAMIPKNKITEALKMFKMNGQPSVDTCLALKEKLSSYSQDSLGADDDMEALERLSTTDIENTPPCVIGAFGNDAIKKKLDNVEKEILLKKMQEMEDTSNIPKSARTIIVREGLKAMDYEMSLSEVDVDQLQHAAADLEGSRLKQLSEDAKNAMINYYNTMAKSHMKPCLNSDQRNAIKDMVLSIKGDDPSTWTTTDDVDCLLDTLPASTLNKIPTEVMAQCSCDRNIQGYEDYVANRESQCMYDIGENEFMKMKNSMKMVEDKAIEAAIETLDTSSSQRRRRKRQATSESGEAQCDKAAVGGADALTTNEIKGMSAEDVMSCLADLGQKMTTEEKTMALADKVYMAKDKDLFTLTSEEIQSLGYILKGFSMEQLKNFTTPASDSDVAALGVDRGLKQDQLNALAMRVLEWKTAESLASIDLKNVNNIVCGFTLTDVGKLTADAIMNAMTTLRNLGTECNKNVTMKLADMAFVEYKKDGAVTDAMMSEMGGLVGSLAPENIQDISVEAMAGLTVQGMEAFGQNEIKSLKIDQIKALPRASAMALTSDQKSHFTAKMTEALEEGPLKDPNMKTKENGASSFVLSSVLCVFGITATLQLL